MLPRQTKRTETGLAVSVGLGAVELAFDRVVVAIFRPKIGCVHVGERVADVSKVDEEDG